MIVSKLFGPFLNLAVTQNLTVSQPLAVSQLAKPALSSAGWITAGCGADRCGEESGALGLGTRLVIGSQAVGNSQAVGSSQIKIGRTGTCPKFVHARSVNSQVVIG